MRREAEAQFAAGKRGALPAPYSRRRPRRRGSIYAVVLGMALLVSLIGLSAVAVGRVNLRAAAAGSAGADCELLALSAVEYAATVVNTEANWRTKYANDAPSAPAPLGRGTFSWKLVDEADGELSLGGLQPVRVYGFGRAGESRRAFSVQLRPAGPNLLNNADAESGTVGYEVTGADCVLESSSTDPHGGGRSIAVRSRLGAAAGPQQNVSGKVATGRSYYAELWAKMTVQADEPSVSLVLKTAGQPDTVFRARTQKVGLEWTRVYCTLNPAWSIAPDAVYLRVATAATGQDFKIDDLRLVEAATLTPMAPASDSWRQEALP